MRRTVWLGIAATLSMVCAGATLASAGGIPPTPQFVEWRKSSGWLGLVDQTVKREEKRLATGCAATKVLGTRLRLLTLPLMPPPMKSKGKGGGADPTQGRWLELVDIDRCGLRTRHSLLATAQRSGPPRISVLVCGLTRTGPELMLELSRVAMSTAGVSSGCTERARVVHTQVHKELVASEFDRSGRQTAGQWQEDWVVRACGSNRTVRFTLTADGKGGTNYSGARL